jgi:hypothetical protein
MVIRSLRLAPAVGVLVISACASETPNHPISSAVSIRPVCKSGEISNCLYVPSDQDRVTLRSAAQQCGLHDRTLSFGQLIPSHLEYDIKIDRSFGDSDDRIECAVSRLPPDFMMKFGIGPI